VDAELEEAKKWRLLVVGAKAAEELWIGDKAPPAPADGGGAWEGGWLRRETDEDLPEHVLDVQQGGRRPLFAAAATDAAGHSGAVLIRLGLGMEARAAAVCHFGALLTRGDLGMEAWAAAKDHSGAILTRLDLRTEARAEPAIHCVDLGLEAPAVLFLEEPGKEERK
jgi:hypothetical protein